MPSLTAFTLALTGCLVVVGVVVGLMAGRVVPLFARHDPEPDDDSGPPPPS